MSHTAISASSPHAWIGSESEKQEHSLGHNLANTQPTFSTEYDSAGLESYVSRAVMEPMRTKSMIALNYRHTLPVH